MERLGSFRPCSRAASRSAAASPEMPSLRAPSSRERPAISRAHVRMFGFTFGIGPVLQYYPLPSRVPYAACLEVAMKASASTVTAWRWRVFTEDCDKFLDRWGTQAASLGWGAMELFG